MEKIHTVEGKELFDLLVNNGILHEVNRTFFHILGLSLTVRYNEEHDDAILSLQKTDNEEGFVFPTLDKFKQKTFNSLRDQKSSARQELLGFVLQIRDMYSTESEEIVVKQPYETSRVNAIVSTIEQFAFAIKTKIFKKHSTQDVKRNFPSREELAAKLLGDIQDGDFIDIAAHAAMLYDYEELSKKINELIAEDVKESNSSL